MMQNGMSGQNQALSGMQRPQPGNPMQQIHLKILTALKNGMPRFAGGWQATFDPRERAQYIMQV